MRAEYKITTFFYILARWSFLTIYVLASFGIAGFRAYEMGDDIPVPLSEKDEFPGPQQVAVHNILKDPSRSGLMMPSASNFEKVSSSISAALNRVNVMQDGQVDIDSTDLDENYDNFTPSKYEAVLNGERHYKYLKFEKTWYHDQPRIKAVVNIPDSNDGHYAQEYIKLVLNTLSNEYKIDTSNVSSKEINLIARDVSELGRFTCIKFLRLVWAIFSDGENDTKGLFPQVYQMQVVDAGELGNTVEGGIDIFAQNQVEVVRASQVSFANISNSSPEKRVNLFDNKVVVFFRPTDKRTAGVDNGHVGVGKLLASYDSSGAVNGFTISFVEVNGFTGQSHYRNQMDLNEFRSHLYFNTPSNSPMANKTIGWFINR